MKKTKLTRSLLAACSIVALSAVMYGCTGDGSENDLIATQEALDQEREAHAATQGELDTANSELMTANGEVTRLTGELGTANSALMTANGDVTRLTGELMTANGDVTRLTGELMTANGDVTRLTGELMTANGDVTRLTGELMTANGDVTRLTGEVTRLEGELDTANGTIETLNDRITALETGTADDVLMPIKEAASDAATAAGTASTAAGAAADAAEEADDNRATIQTGEANSVADAMYARAHADTAEAEAMKAQAASTAAQGAMTAGEATPLREAAEAAQAVAKAAQADAETARDNAVADSMLELKVDDKTKMVGENSITIDGKANEVTRIVNGVRTVTLTGHLMPIVTLGEALDGTENDDATDVDESRPGADARTDLAAGFVYDSADDKARLAMFNKYAGTDTVTAFVDGTGMVTGGTGGFVDDIDHDGDSSEDSSTPVRSLPLRNAGGTFMMASGSSLDANTEETIAAATTKTTIYYYETNEGRQYVRFQSLNVDGQYTYQAVDIEAGAKIPAVADYDHVHFGVWAGLGDADSITGDNDVTDLGIGFVVGLSDMTGDSDVPNHGDAIYNGNWVASIQAADDDGDGSITLTNGRANIEADFRRGEIDVKLMGLVTLEGDIEGNMFMGSFVNAELVFDDVNADTDGVQATSGLNPSGEFDGSFEGGFFGDDAEEVGGVFDFSSRGNEDGAFRGAFGAHEDEDVKID